MAKVENFGPNSTERGGISNVIDNRVGIYGNVYWVNEL